MYMGMSEYLRLKIFLPIAERLVGTCATKWYRQISDMNEWPREKIIAWQNQHLSAFVRHAYEHTIYYKNLFDSLGLKPEDIRCADDLGRLPVMTKDIVQSHFKELIPDDISSIPHRKNKTGGTTGEPMDFLTDENVWGYITASKIYSWRKAGYRFGDKFVALGSSSLLGKKQSIKRRVYDGIRREIGMNSMNMSDTLCASYLDIMRHKHIHFLYGYASSVFLMAKYAAENKVDVSFIKGVFTTSENLPESYRSLIESTFCCRVMDCYGAKDAGITAFEILPGKYHVSYDVIPEVVNSFGEGEGTLITTCFLNNAFPLMRYDFGDCARLSLSDDSYNGAVITKVFGRESNVIRLNNGHVLTAPGYTILMNHFNVIAYRIQQVNDHEVKMLIQINPDKWSYEESKQLQSEMQRFVGEGCLFSLEVVDSFEPLENGKRGYFINR